MDVYLLWDGTDDWGSNPKVRLHAIYSNKKLAEEAKEEQHLKGAFFYIEKKTVITE